MMSLQLQPSRWQISASIHFFELCQEYSTLTSKFNLVASNSYGPNAHIWLLCMNVRACKVLETSSQRQGCVRGHWQLKVS